MVILESYYILVVIFGILTLLLLISLLFINRLFSRKERIDLLFDNVMKYVDERILLFERMTNFVEENVEEELKYVDDLNKYNNILSEMLTEKKYNLKEIQKSEKLLDKFRTLIDTYSFLGKNEIYKILSYESGINVERIEYAVSSYNERVKEYNEFKKTKLNSFIAKIFRLSDYEYYDK